MQSVLRPTLVSLFTLALGATPPVAASTPGPATFRGGAVEVVPHEVLVTFAPGTSRSAREAVAAQAGATQARVSAYAEVAVLGLPPGAEPVLASLRAHPAVRDVRPHVVARAACATGVCGSGDRPLVSGDWQTGFQPTAAQLYPYQWYHHQQYDWLAWDRSSGRGASVKVAVLDTGVTPVSSLPLTRVDVASDANFVTPGADARDDNGHGTQMATLIAASGALWGVAPEATIVAVKVLDADRVGTEAALIDGLLYAASVDGVRVISMSLTFPPGYRPSPALADAIEAVAAQGVVMVAAAGNDGVDQVGFPASFPQVIAVGAVRLARGDGGAMGVVSAEYSNRGNAVDVVAAGGDLARDEDGDGIPDGVLVESLQSADAPSGLYLTAGTSPAAALAAGAVALLLDAGVPAGDVRDRLQATAQRVTAVEYSASWGHGLIHVGAAMPDATPWYARTEPAAVFANPQVVFEATPAGTRAVAVVEVSDADGAPCVGCEVRLQFGGEVLGCTSAFSDAAGVVAVPSAALPPEAEGLVSVAVTAVVHPGDWRAAVPHGAVRVDRGSFELLSTLGTGLVSSALVLDYSDDAWTDSPYVDAAHLVDSYLVRSFGVSHLSPTAVGMLPGFFEARGLAARTLLLQTEGTGLISSGIIFDRALFSAARRATWGQDPLYVMLPTTGTGLISSGIIWDQQLVAYDRFVTDGDLGVLFGLYGGDRGGAVVVRDRGIFNEALMVGSVDATGPPGAEDAPGDAETLFVADFSEDTVTALGGSWDSVRDLYATPPDGLATTMMALDAPLMVMPDLSTGQLRTAPPGSVDSAAFPRSCAGPAELGAVNACGGCGVDNPPEVCDGLDNDCDGDTDEGFGSSCAAPQVGPVVTDADVSRPGDSGCAGGGPGSGLAVTLLLLLGALVLRRRRTLRC
jgi:MYXO-CTERM domain-containing protein